VGWGGYYAWDPVENAALMPWLAATAFLHSVMIQEKRGMLRVWNHLLSCWRSRSRSSARS
jgi:cytochrome c-type biogenesis protein CcmF